MIVYSESRITVASYVLVFSDYFRPSSIVKDISQRERIVFLRAMLFRHSLSMIRYV